MNDSVLGIDQVSDAHANTWILCTADSEAASVLCFCQLSQWAAIILQSFGVEL